MYFVYKLTFEDGCYIGCTSNIRRRKQQHNEKGRSNGSKLGRYLNQRDIVLTEDDFEILYSFEDRPMALKKEKELCQKYVGKGIKLLNDNYTPECSRKGKNIGHTAKEFVVIDFVEHTSIRVHDLRQYCLQNHIDYRLIHRTASTGHYCLNRYKCFYADDWDKEDDKEKYLSGKFLEDVEKKVINGHVNKCSKTYEVMFPDKHTEVIKNLDKFAREHNLTSGTLHATLSKNKPTKGYQVLRRI